MLLAKLVRYEKIDRSKWYFYRVFYVCFPRAGIFKMYFYEDLFLILILGCYITILDSCFCEGASRSRRVVDIRVNLPPVLLWPFQHSKNANDVIETADRKL